MSTAPFQLTLFDPSRKDATGTPRAATGLTSEQETVRSASQRGLPNRAPDQETGAQRSPLTFASGRELENETQRGALTQPAEKTTAQKNTLARPPERDQVLERANALAFRLSRELALSVRLSVTDNRSTMVSFRRAPSGLRLRLHHMFLDAPEAVVQAIADYAGRGKRHAGRVLDDFIRGRQPLIRQHRHDGEGELDPRGQCFDLQEIFRAINARFFQDGIQARIGWGRMPGRRRRKSIRLGVYDHQTREIRIHPSLDRVDVPRFFVEFIVFHEMLHQIFPSPPGFGRRVHHPRAFRDRERAFPLYEAAIRWEKQNLRLLLKG